MRRLREIFPLFPVVSALLLLPGCGGEDSPATPGANENNEVPAAHDPTAHPYRPYFEAAGKEFDVPANLLVAIGYVETRLYHVPGDASEIDGISAAFGVMALRGESLERGATLAGLSIAEVEKDPASNIRAAAALLSAFADELGLDRADLGAWAPAVGEYMGHPSLEVQSHYIREEVYRYLEEGIAAPEDSGLRDILEATPDVSPQFPSFETIEKPVPVTDAVYSGAVWRPAPSSNYTSGRSGYSAELLVVHTCAGAYSGCWGWLTTPYPTNPYKTSAHYVVNESGSEVSALVDENNTAHHVGKSWQGYPTNPRSVGIEHGGYPYAGSNVWSEGQIASSAKLACDIVKRQNIIRDRNHIIGHYQPDPVNRANDPGTAFPWSDYMNRIATCIDGAGGGGATITVDSNNANNNAAVARMVAPSANWTASTNVASYYGTGYWVAPTEAVSDGAHFEFYLPAAATKKIYAWWTSATDRSTTTPFVVFDGNGTKLGTVSKNQQVNGGSWQEVGTFNLTAGWNRVTVSRWTTAGYQVVADAVQVR
jgi:hypothetical protein